LTASATQPKFKVFFILISSFTHCSIFLLTTLYSRDLIISYRVYLCEFFLPHRKDSLFFHIFLAPHLFNHRELT